MGNGVSYIGKIQQISILSEQKLETLDQKKKEKKKKEKKRAK